MSFALTIFISAFFLFQVQPIIARYILPWYGGSPAVWSTCMLFFQVGLLTGYIYAHLLARYLGLLFDLGGCAGMYCGAKLQRFVPAYCIQAVLACSVLFIAFRYSGFF